MKLVPISLDSRYNAEFEADPNCKESLQMTVDFFKRVGYFPPWIGYFAKQNQKFIGAAAFKGKPKDNKVEIAYGTFPGFEGRGMGTEICRQLVMLALKTDPGLIITARTLPQENASTAILKKNGFTLVGTIWDEEDGNVWEWIYNGENSETAG